MANFQIRNFLCDYSLLPPRDLGKTNTESKNEVPIIHLFGATEAGTKACVHIYGALPYLVMKVGGELTSRVEILMAEKLNKLLHYELNRKKGPEQAKEDARIPNFIHHIEPFQAKSLYGYHSQMETFARIYFYNPFHIPTLTGALGQLAIENPFMQPFEAHVPFILQFFIDYSIFGMDWVHFKSVKFRLAENRNDDEIVFDNMTVREIRSKPELLSPLPPTTSCFLEIDANVVDILNSKLHADNIYSSNPGLEYIWKEEAERCRLQNRTLEDSFNQYTPRPYPSIRSEMEYLEKLKRVANLLQEKEESPQVVQESSQQPKTVNAESLWTQALQQNEMEKEWTDTQDISNYGLEDGWTRSDQLEATEDEDPKEMTILVEEAGTNSVVTKKEELTESPSAMETTFLDYSRNADTPIAPQEQQHGTWYEPRKNLPIRRRLKTKALTRRVENANSPEPQVEMLTSMRDKMSFIDDTLVSIETQERASPEEATQSDGRIEEIRNVSVASLELFIHTKHKMPSPITDTILAISLCIVDDACRHTQVAFHSVLTTIDKKVMDNVDTIRLPTETILLEKVAALIKQFDPDILIGYDTERLSWGYLIKRAEIIGIAKFEEKLGRYLNPRRQWKKEQKAMVDGRLLEPIWRIVRQDLSLRSYDRATSCLAILKKRIPILDDFSLSQRFNSTGASLGRVIHTHLRRYSMLNILLLNKMDWFIRNAEMARVYGIQFHEVWTRGSQLRVESMLLRQAHKMKFVAPSVTVEQRDRMCAPEQLQLIMEPESKVYNDPVIVLDFQSLYPSMMIAYNYCFSTLFGKIGNLTAAAELDSTFIELGALKYAMDKESLVKMISRQKAHSSPLCTAFAQKDFREGVIPTLLREVMGARIMIKTAMKNTKNQRLLRILDARQLALKLVANVTYGYTAANWSGRMPCVEVADAILAKGRETLERAISKVNSGNYGGARVIYGDTDSMFVLVKGATLCEAFTIGRRIANDVTADNPAPVVLKLEKVYTGCVLETKKRYAGWMYESEKDKPKLDAKGIETVRRDTCPIVSKILEKSLEYILQKKYNRFLSFLDRRLTLLHETHFTEFVFCKEFRGEYDEHAPVPQKRVAEYKKAESPGYLPLRGERLPYVVVSGEPDSTVISCVRSLDEFLADEDLKINIPYYIRAHILAALNRVTELIPLNIDYLNEASMNCFGRDCYSTGGIPWCQKCAVPNKTYISATLQMTQEQRIFSAMRAICKDCQKTREVDIEACENRQCPVNKVIMSLSRSVAPLAVISHRRHSALRAAEDSEVTATQVLRNQDIEDVEMIEEENEDEETYHERSIFQLSDEETHW